MARPNRISRIALLSLLLAIVIAVAGLWLKQTALAPFWGGLLLAFGEAALVGGLADWFAVRALFAHPLGLPFPHTALIPRSRERIINEISALVQNEWLPQSLLVDKLEEFDFVSGAVLPVIEPMRPWFRELLRSVGEDLLRGLTPAEAARSLSDGLARSITPDSVGPFLASLARRAAEQRWLEPFLHEWADKLREWAASEQSHAVIRKRLEAAADTYQGHSFLRSLTYGIAELTGGIDLDHAATVVQTEIGRFSRDQLEDHSPLQRMVREGLLGIEGKLREDPEFMDDLRGFFLETAQGGTLHLVLTPVLTSLREAALEDLESPEGSLLDWASRPLDAWLDRVRQDEKVREQVNQWCRRLGRQLLERHHSMLGALVTEQLGRLSERGLTDLIEERVGEDLSWIRLNGTFVGGLIGVVLFLLFQLVSWAL